MKYNAYRADELKEVYGLTAKYERSEFDSNGVLIGSYATIQRKGKDGVTRVLKPFRTDKSPSSVMIQFAHNEKKQTLSYFRTLYALTTADISEDEVIYIIDPFKPINDFSNLMVVSLEDHLKNLKEKRKRN